MNKFSEAQFDKPLDSTMKACCVRGTPSNTVRQVIGYYDDYDRCWYLAGTIERIKPFCWWVLPDIPQSIIDTIKKKQPNF